MEKVKDRRNKENKVPTEPKGNAITACPGCGEELGFTLLATKNGAWVNGNWYPGSYSHCSKFKIGV